MLNRMIVSAKRTCQALAKCDGGLLSEAQPSRLPYLANASEDACAPVKVASGNLMKPLTNAKLKV